MRQFTAVIERDAVIAMLLEDGAPKVESVFVGTETVEVV
jgi:hypothetical protein